MRQEGGEVCDSNPDTGRASLQFIAEFLCLFAVLQAQLRATP